MSTTPGSGGPPRIADLLVRYFAKASDAAAAVEACEPEVEPYEAASGFRIDPLIAWQDAVNYHITPCRLSMPGEWPALVHLSLQQWAVPCCLGEWPQRVNRLSVLLAPEPLQRLLPAAETLTPLPGLTQLRRWIAAQAPSYPLVAAGVARALRDWDLAERYLPAAPSQPNLSSPRLAHPLTAGQAIQEQAALLWLKGHYTLARDLWDTAPESPAVLFNRGMARLFLDEAVEPLRRAARELPESSGWQALAELYAVVAEIRTRI